MTSLPSSGRAGIFCDRINEQTAKPAPIRNTAAGETIQTKPNAAGTTTAAMWLIVNEIPALLAISPGLAIFWKYVLTAIASAKNI